MDKRDDNLKWLKENFNYVDSVTIVDNTGKIITKKRFNPRFTDEENEIDNEWAVNRNLLEVFPSLNHEDSSLFRALATGKIIHYENQETWNHAGRRIITNNITFPIISRGRIVGAVEISRDVTHIEGKVKKLKLASVSKQAGKSNIKSSGAKYTNNDIITENPAMIDVKKTIAQIANSTSSVLVYGETGTGKELVVSAIHNSGYRKNRPFVAVNCAALPESILEGLLFGSRKGAFTGAENKKGLFEEAHGGTIYLDEINSMPIDLQAKLLRVLQEKTVMPLGESRPIEVDTRIIASTNRPVQELKDQGKMREDLLYRLNTINITIPPLRDRIKDIELLSRHFINKYNVEFDKNVVGISDDAILFLSNQGWKGNVRELEHVIEAAMNIVEDYSILSLEHLPAYLIGTEPKVPISKRTLKNFASLTDSLATYEKKLIVDALKICNWSITDAAKALKVPRTTLQYKMEKFKISKNDGNPLK